MNWFMVLACSPPAADLTPSEKDSGAPDTATAPVVETDNDEHTAPETGSTATADTADTGCAPQPEIPLDGVDQGCDGAANELGYGESAADAAMLTFYGTQLGTAYDGNIDVGYDAAGTLWLGVADAINAEFIALLPAGLTGLYVEERMIYVYPTIYGVGVANWEGPPFITLGTDVLDAYEGEGVQQSRVDAVAEIWLSPATDALVVDFDADGVDELIAGGPVDGIWVIEAPADGAFPEPFLVIEPGAGAGSFAYFLGDVGDVTGDGVAESTARDAQGGGRAWIFPTDLRGTFVTDDVGWYLEGEHAGDDFGDSIAIGDLDGDGYNDVASGAPISDQGIGFAAGITYVVPGPIVESAQVVDVASAWSAGQAQNEACGLPTETVDDQDGDGAAELATACLTVGPLPGRLELYSGASLSGSFDHASAARVFVSVGAGGSFSAVEGHTDITADGIVDLVLGDPGGALAPLGPGAVFVIAGPLF